MSRNHARSFHHGARCGCHPHWLGLDFFMAIRINSKQRSRLSVAWGLQETSRKLPVVEGFLLYTHTHTQGNSLKGSSGFSSSQQLELSSSGWLHSRSSKGATPQRCKTKTSPAIVPASTFAQRTGWVSLGPRHPVAHGLPAYVHSCACRRQG